MEINDFAAFMECMTLFHSKLQTSRFSIARAFKPENCTYPHQQITFDSSEDKPREGARRNEINITVGITLKYGKLFEWNAVVYKYCDAMFIEYFFYVHDDDCQTLWLETVKVDSIPKLFDSLHSYCDYMEEVALWIKQSGRDFSTDTCVEKELPEYKPGR